VTASPPDLDMLAYDIADMLDRNSYPIDAAADDIRPHLPAFLAAIQTTPSGPGDEPGPDAASWIPSDNQAEPAIQVGRRPAAAYLPWQRSQTVNLGAAARDAHYWQCPKTGCRVWAGPYADPTAGKQVGMDHVYYEHDLPAAQAAEQRRAARKAALR
jgi:hypothetical protein